MPRSTPPDIAALDPVRDHLKIVQWVGEYEFPFETQRSLEFALFRTFAAHLLQREGNPCVSP